MRSVTFDTRRDAAARLDRTEANVRLNGADILSVSASYYSLAEKRHEQRWLDGALEYPTGAPYPRILTGRLPGSTL